MSGHTPGPWTWDDESGDWPDHWLVGSDGDYALQWDMDLGFLFGKPADKPLIAASPLLLAACKALLACHERSTCAHEETYRGGSIWEICHQCGARWADDEGGKPEWQDPPEWEAARAAIAAAEGEPS